MLRFLPNDWLEWLLRPFIMLDPSQGVYFEQGAPDLKWAALILCLAACALAALAGRGRWRPAPGAGSLLVGLGLSFYGWTWISGNGRYFLAGLLLAGPLLVLTVRALPGTAVFRVLTLAGLAGLQAAAVATVYSAGHWGLVPWRHGAAVAIEANPLRERPAIFLTVTGPSYSLLVPHFHPASRWANVAGQRNIRPQQPEFARLMSLLSSDLPKYVLIAWADGFVGPAGQPNDELATLMNDMLAAYGIGLAPQATCPVVRADVNPRTSALRKGDQLPEAFWACPVERSAGAGDRLAHLREAQRELDAIFEQVEHRCPRFFPPGEATEGHYEGYSIRHYPSTDIRLYVETRGRVLYKYYRAVNPTLIGPIKEVRAGRFKVDCVMLPGRYRPPWSRD